MGKTSTLGDQVTSSPTAHLHPHNRTYNKCSHAVSRTHMRKCTTFQMEFHRSGGFFVMCFIAVPLRKSLFPWGNKYNKPKQEKYLLFF